MVRLSLGKKKDKTVFKTAEKNSRISRKQQSERVAQSVSKKLFLRKRNHFFDNDDLSENSFPLEKGPNKRLVLNKDLLAEFAQMAYYANKAYCYPDNGKVVFGKVDITNESDAIIFYFRGKELSLREWNAQNDNWIAYNGIENSKVARKILEDFEKSEIDIYEMIQKYLTPSRKFQLVGHGVGGGFALFTALLIKKFMPRSKIKIYSFGQPRIGNGHFARHVNKILPNRIFRITYKDDFVSRFPRSSYGWWHYETEYWITNENNCDCFGRKSNNITQVYRCRGEEIGPTERFRDVFVENIECNKRTKTEVEFIHYGPYFGQLMGQCPELL
ncbi:hypothetical protein G9A89_018294 [Geosiphon pyriformis]|nr:hypothetical protein G9A89_018294 [Geosiphon pyriformis]